MRIMRKHNFGCLSISEVVSATSDECCLVPDSFIFTCRFSTCKQSEFDTHCEFDTEQYNFQFV